MAEAACSRDAASSQWIRVKGARTHNLQNVSLDLPRECIVVVTGVSGSGKSSLVVDTLFAEGRRRYLECLSVQTRQFLETADRPDVDVVEGLPPAILLDQKPTLAAPRSTLATTTEIHPFLRLLYARAGTVHCPRCESIVSSQSPESIVERILAGPPGRRILILAPLVRQRRGRHREVLERAMRDGFVRARVDGVLVDLASPPQLDGRRRHDVEAVVDRLVVKPTIRSRLRESVELAFRHGNGQCVVAEQSDDAWNEQLFSSRWACPNCGVNLPNVEPRLFSFSSPEGACPRCDGLGFITVPNTRARHPGESLRSAGFRQRSSGLDLLPQADTAAGTAICPECGGARLGEVGRHVRFRGYTLPELCALTVAELSSLFDAWTAELRQGDGWSDSTAEGKLAASRLFPEVRLRLQVLQQAGLEYLTLDRPTRSLSAGEYQRARLAACLGSGLTGACYLLDEPTLGLHARDTARLIDVLRELKNRGNTLLVVEHDVEMMRAADWLVDLGPGAGRDGGRVMAQGPPNRIAAEARTPTGKVLSAQFVAGSDLPRCPIDPSRQLRLLGAHRHNLRDIDVTFPLGVLTCVTGVSGSGKTTLVLETLVPAVAAVLAQRNRDAAATASADDHACRGIEGAETLERLVVVDRTPLGRSARSCPATYVGLWDDVRRLFAKTRGARARGFGPRRFSFNVAGGRCPHCKGQGVRVVQMDFLSDLATTCPHCRGLRFEPRTLQVRYRGRHVGDVLNMTVDEARAFFSELARLRRRLELLEEVGLGYLQLGQSALTLSGGEAQRLRLARELSGSAGTGTLLVLDEPTAGLHPVDIDRLIRFLRRLTQQGATVVVVEHQLDVIAAADWVVDLGPEGGPHGGRLVVAGPPEQVAQSEESFTGRALKNFGVGRR